MEALGSPNDGSDSSAPPDVADERMERSTNRTSSAITKAEHTWIIENFEHLAQMLKIESPVFKLGGVSWQLKMYPKFEEKKEDSPVPQEERGDGTPSSGGGNGMGESSSSGGNGGSSRSSSSSTSTPQFVSLYLYCNGPEYPSTCWNLKIPNHKSHQRSICGGRRAYLFSQSASRGFRKFCKTSRLLNKRAGFLDAQGALTVCVTLDWVMPLSSATVTRSQPSLARDFSDLLRTGMHSDVMLECRNGHTRAVHKAVLAARSPVFRRMFSHEMKESIDNRVKIDDVDAEVIDAMLAYMYGEEEPVNDVVTRRLLLLADRYDMKGLLQQCQFVLAKCLTVDNACEIAVVCDMLRGASQPYHISMLAGHRSANSSSSSSGSGGNSRSSGGNSLSNRPMSPASNDNEMNPELGGLDDDAEMVDSAEPSNTAAASNSDYSSSNSSSSSSSSSADNSNALSLDTDDSPPPSSSSSSRSKKNGSSSTKTAPTSALAEGQCQELTAAVINFIVDRLDHFLPTDSFKALMTKCPNLVTFIMMSSRSSSSMLGKKRKYNCV